MTTPARTTRTEDDRELSRIHYFMKLAVKSTGLRVGDHDVARLALCFRNAMRENNALMQWQSHFDDEAKAMEADTK